MKLNEEYYDDCIDEYDDLSAKMKTLENNISGLKEEIKHYTSELDKVKQQILNCKKIKENLRYHNGWLKFFNNLKGKCLLYINDDCWLGRSEYQFFYVKNTDTEEVKWSDGLMRFCIDVHGFKFVFEKDGSIHSIEKMSDGIIDMATVYDANLFLSTTHMIPLETFSDLEENLWSVGYKTLYDLSFFISQKYVDYKFE